MNSVFTAKENVGVVLLTVLNATAEDSGEFACVASNGIGGKASRNVSFLLVRRKFILEFLHFFTGVSNVQEYLQTWYKG